MSEQEEIIAILRRFHRRIAFYRAVESAATVLTASAVVAFTLMVAWTLAGRFAHLASIVALLPFLPAGVLTMGKSLRVKVYRARPIQWLTMSIFLVGALFGLMELLTGRYADVPRISLLSIIPFAGVVGFLIAALQPIALKDIALWIDRQADLKERLTTALEAVERGERNSFSQAVCRQAMSSFRGKRGAIKRADYWTKTRATVGAMTLAILAAVSMLLITPLKSPLQQDNLGEVSRQASESLRRNLDAIGLGDLIGNPLLREKIHRLEQITDSLRTARPVDANGLEGKVVELDAISDSLRKAIASGRLDADTAARLERLVDAIEEAKRRIVAQIGRTGLARGANEPPPAGRVSGITPSGIVPSRASTPADFQPLMVYDPRYSAFARSAQPGSSIGKEEHRVRIPFDRAWSAARQQAAEMISTGRIPQQYRRLIHDFFLVGQ